MLERDFQTKFTRWAHYRFEGVGAFELKICRGTSLSFDVVKEHQVASLKAVKHDGLEYKIPDDTRGTKPFDFFKLKGAAYVVVLFYQRGVKHFYLIDVDVWIQEVESSERKSLTEDRAREIGQLQSFS